jgi:hypothetical protein
VSKGEPQDEFTDWRPVIEARVWRKRSASEELHLQANAPHHPGSKEGAWFVDCDICNRHICCNPDCDADREGYSGGPLWLCAECFGHFPRARVEGA